ncbi:hypothetical protein BKA63DRAFT_582343 [Paraphoma chrysanthemicola]|nr:hypothetical protein BKA63DRAFT_582343 [Paraphoma chrysanthemicola]
MASRTKALLFFILALRLVLSQWTMQQIRTVSGIESVVDYRIAGDVSDRIASVQKLANITRRWDGSPAYDEWLPAHNRGCMLNGMMNADDAGAGKLFTPPLESAHSRFFDINDLRRWGYVTRVLRRDPKCDMGNGKDAFGLETYFNARGISTAKDDWKCKRITHGNVNQNLDEQTYPDPRDPTRQLRMTGARYHIAMNSRDGVIVVAKQYSPAHQSQYRRPPVPVEEYPELRSSSDVIWLAWKAKHDQGAKLNLIITWTVTNGRTQRILARAIDPQLEAPDSQRALKSYPWVGWTAESTSGKAMLGSPNGSGIGYFLAQHKPELGNRRVKRIEAFAADTQASGMFEPSIAWEIEDIPASDEVVEML